MSEDKAIWESIDTQAGADADRVGLLAQLCAVRSAELMGHIIVDAQETQESKWLVVPWQFLCKRTQNFLDGEKVHPDSHKVHIQGRHTGRWVVVVEELQRRFAPTTTIYNLHEPLFVAEKMGLNYALFGLWTAYWLKRFQDETSRTVKDFLRSTNLTAALTIEHRALAQTLGVLTDIDAFLAMTAPSHALMKPAEAQPYPDLPENEPKDTEPPVPETEHCEALWNLVVDRDLAKQRLITLIKTPEQRRNHHCIEIMTRLVKTPNRIQATTTREPIAHVRGMKADFPNFHRVIDWVCDELELRAALREPVKLPPMLMLGAPGIGKTHFVMRLSEVIGFQSEYRSLAETTAGWVISGMSPCWTDATPGVVADLLSRLDLGKAPLMFYDEIDKVAPDAKYPVLPVFLTLLEPKSAAVFRDEFLGIRLDTRPMNYVFAANRLENIPVEVLSRLQVFDIPSPDFVQMDSIVRSIDNELRNARPGLAERFEPLDAEVILRLRRCQPRAARRLLERAYGIAARGQCMVERLQVRLEDLPPEIIDASSPWILQAPQDSKGKVIVH